ncbi:unnamed protein product [Linum tenue]|uniref:Receptor-like protein 51 n=1 Tax=Linum tenue TaxID=586396 RepID=A0AAV0RTR3_9ROSI|nr:unnamed protein product [Linum tenue]
MSPPPPLLLFLLLCSLSATASAAGKSTAVAPAATPPSSPVTIPAPSTSSHSTLDPKQLRALQSLSIPTAKDPCAQNNAATTCDAAAPFRHVVSLHLSNCSDDVSLSFTALESLSTTLQSLSFTNCPISPIRFPSDLALNLRSFSCAHSLKHLAGVWLSRFANLTDLTVTDVPVNASGLYVVIGNMHKLRTVTITNANLTGSIPKHWVENLTHVDLSRNGLKGKIPSSIAVLENLESLNLSSNALAGELPANFGDLTSLKNVSLASNSLSGSIPDSISAIPGLEHLDLSSNQFNGTIPKFFTEMKHLKHLNLANNAFRGVLPFNASFLERLEVFKIKGNDNLCYNHTSLSSKLKLGIAQCDKHGPMSPPPSKDLTSGDNGDSSDYDDGNDSGGSSSKKEGHHGPNKVFLGLVIALSSIVFLIVFLILIAKRCT